VLMQDEVRHPRSIARSYQSVLMRDRWGSKRT
jgi:hypothetical protein